MSNNKIATALHTDAHPLVLMPWSDMDPIAEILIEEDLVQIVFELERLCAPAAYVEDYMPGYVLQWHSDSQTKKAWKYWAKEEPQ